MNILLIHQYFLEKDDGGGSRFNEMTRLWAEKEHKVTVLAGMVHYASGKKAIRYKGKYFFKDSNYYNGVDVMRCHVSEQYNTNFLGRLWAYFSFVFSGIWAGLFKIKGKYDIIVVTSPPLFVGIIAYTLAKIKGLPMVFEVRDLWPESAIDTGVLKNKWIIKFAYWFEGFIYKKAAIINVLTPAFRDKLIEKGIPEDKIVMIPNAADFSLATHLSDDFDAYSFRKTLGIENKFVITYVGAHGVANHLIQLVEVADQLRETNVVFQLIGSGMEKQALIAAVKENNLQDLFIFREPVSKAEVFKYIMASDMGASVLKKVETFKTIYSNKTFDYMSCKIPVLLLIDGVSRQLVEEAKCGVYLEPENAFEIARGVKKMLQMDKKLLNEWGVNGYYYARKYFDREILAQKYIEVFNRV